MTSYSTQQIAEHIGGSLEGPADLSIHGMNQLEAAQPGELTFIGDEAHARLWPDSHASAALVAQSLELTQQAVGEPTRALIRVVDADLAAAQVLELFAPPDVHPADGIHPHASVDPTAQLGEGVEVGPGAVVGPRVQVGAGSRIHAGVHILGDCQVGPDCVLWPGVVVRERCVLGRGVIVQPNAVIGSDGFGYRPASDGQSLIRIPQIGSVEIHDEVEIGAGTCIDRGKFAATVIGRGTKIDNICQIAHNCRIGQMCVIAGASALAGSVHVGNWVQIGGMVGIKDHLSIGDGARIAAGALLMENIPAGETWGGVPARERSIALREYAAVRKLPDLLKSLRRQK